jgi:hypothetical protein
MTNLEMIFCRRFTGTFSINSSGNCETICKESITERTMIEFENESGQCSELERD